ncbi:MAG: hypothetical protein RL660_432 [Bacteroidota bacterium]|jgi:hypothetical protein
MTTKEAIKLLAGNNSEATQLVACVVVAIDTADCTCSCEPLAGGAAYNVRLRSIAAEHKDGILLVPAVDSVVVIATIGKNTGEAIIIAYSDVTSVAIHTTSGAKIDLAEDMVIVNGDKHGGLVIVNKLVQKLNALENALNQLVANFNSHTHLVPAMPAAPGAGGIPSIVPMVPSTITLTTTTTHDIENQKVKHGEG